MRRPILTDPGSSGDDSHINFCGSGLFENAGDFTRGGTGRHNIVDQQDRLSSHIYFALQGKCSADI